MSQHTTGLTRSTFRNVWALTMLVMIGLIIMVFQQGQGQKEAISSKTFQLDNLKGELVNAARRATALKELDSLTINEKTATRLDILRHLVLEQSGYQFQVNARQVKVVAGTSLYLRLVQLTAQLPYAEAMSLIDRLHETQKIVINTIEIRRPTEAGDFVQLSVEGTIYGLEKNDE